jgi:ADP-ribose pyrophosphatase YjhB (NUDIX family)
MIGNQEIRINARGVIICNGKILLCKEREKDHYFLPGGGVEFMEGVKEALIREIEEETNIILKDWKFIGVVESIFSYKGKMLHEINIVFYTESDKSPKKSMEEHIEFKMVNTKRLSTEKILPKTLKEGIMRWLKDGRIFWGTFK